MLKLIDNPVLYAAHARTLETLGVLQEQRGDSVVARADAAADTMHLARELEYVDAKTYQVLTDPIKGRTFVDFETVPDGAETFTYFMWDRVGKVDWITNYSDFVGSADAFKAATSMRFYDMGGSYAYSITDLQRAAFAKTNLSAERAQSNRIAHEQKLDDLIANGDAERGIRGLGNSTDFQEVDPTTGEIDPEDVEPTDPDDYEAYSQVLANDFKKLVISVEERTAEQFQANFVIYPLSMKKVLARRYSRYDSRSREAVMLAESPGVTLKYWKRLNTASALGGPKALAYAKNPLVLKFMLAYEYRTLPPQAHGYAYQVGTMARFGGLCVTYPLACSRMDLDKDLTP